MKEEVERLLPQVVAAPQSISSVFREHFGSKKGVVLNLSARPPKPRDGEESVDFEELS